ncbi:MAG: MucB/RseB C-terminal domain-containing protein [Acidiferrobacterales bacterium]
MNSLPRKALLLLIAISAGGTVVAGDSSEAREWLKRMTTAMSELSYQGTFVYVRGGEVETMRITHVTDESGVRERLYSISGPRSEVIRDRKGVRFVLQDSGSVFEDSVVASSYFTEFPLSAIGNNSEGYRLELRGKARIAGQTARRVSILPRDNYRYGYDFWLEEKTGLLLQWVLRDPGNRALAKLMFTDFSMGSAVDVDELESDSPAEDFVELRTFSPAKTVGTQSSPSWHPNELPPGFKLSSHSHKTGPDGIFEHLVYSDGLAAVSVYIENKGSEVAVMQGVGQLGTNYAFSRKQGDLQITAIGEVPAITVRTIANSMARSVASN